VIWACAPQWVLPITVGGADVGKGAGLIGLMLPAARDLAQYGIRVVTVAPGLFDTGIFAGVDPKVVRALSSAALNPSRLGEPSEFAALVMHIVENRYLNATTLSIDAGARLPNV